MKELGFLQLKDDGSNETELMARLFSSSLITLLPAIAYSLKVRLPNAISSSYPA